MHGFRSHCDGEKARALAAHAARRGRSWVRFNQRHCGGTNSEFARFTLTQAIDDTVSLLDLLRQPAVLVGSSLGAVIALHATAHRPRLVSGLLLVAPAIRFVTRHFASLPGKDIAAWRETGSRRFPDQYADEDFELNYGFYEDALEYRDPGPWKFHVPVAILHGQHDELLPPEDSIELKDNITAPSVSLDIVANGDHRLNGAIPLMCAKLDTLWNIPEAQ